MKRIASMARLLMMLKLLIVVVGCNSSDLEPGILIIAVDGLKTEDVQCSSAAESGTENEFRGFNFLCQNFIRVQGLVANSTSAAANMGSLLTALPPERHGLRQNSQFMPAEHVLLPEKLIERGWRTSFFSGGAPLSRRTQLNQGFETFDESIPNAPKWPYRSFEQSLQPFFSWLEEDSGRHFSVIALSDLNYPEYPSVSDKGETRPRSLEGQTDELDESLFHFFTQLRRQSLWNNGWVIITGIGGRANSFDKTPAALQIQPGQFLLPLYIRPPHLDEQVDATKIPRVLAGVWSLTQLSEFIEDVVSDIDLPPNRQHLNPMQMLRDREASAVMVEACSGEVCRKAFADQTAWLIWESPLKLDLPGRKDLLAKIRKSGVIEENAAPPRAARPEDLAARPSPPLVSLKDCIEEFEGDPEGGSRFLRQCQSKPAQTLRSMSQLRQTLLARPESLREQKIRFLHDWSQLASAEQIFRKLQPTGLYTDLRQAPANEFLTLQILLERAEFRDIQREALRTLTIF